MVFISKVGEGKDYSDYISPDMDAILADYADEIYSEGNHKINKKLSLLVRKHFLWMKDPLLIPDFRTPEEQEEDSSNRN